MLAEEDGAPGAAEPPPSTATDGGSPAPTGPQPQEEPAPEELALREVFSTILHHVRQDEAWRKWAASFSRHFTEQSTEQQLSMLHGALHTTSRHSTQIGVQPTSHSSTFLRGRGIVQCGRQPKKARTEEHQ